MILETILEETICGIFYQICCKTKEEETFGLKGALQIQEAFYQRNSVVLPVFCYGVETLEKTEHVFNQTLRNVA